MDLFAYPSAAVEKAFSIPADFPTVQAAIDWLGERPNNNCEIVLTQAVTAQELTEINESHFLGDLTIRSLIEGISYQCGRGISIKNCPAKITLQDLGFIANNSADDAAIYVENSGVAISNVSVTGSSPPDVAVNLLNSKADIASLTVNCPATTSLRASFSDVSINGGTVSGGSIAGLIEKLSRAEVDGVNVSASSVNMIVATGSNASFNSCTLNGGDYGVRSVDNSYFSYAGGTLDGHSVDGARTIMNATGRVESTSLQNCGQWGARTLKNAVINTLSNTYSGNGIGNVNPTSAYSIGPQESYRMN